MGCKSPVRTSSSTGVLLGCSLLRSPLPARNPTCKIQKLERFSAISRTVPSAGPWLFKVWLVSRSHCYPNSCSEPIPDPQPLILLPSPNPLPLSQPPITYPVLTYPIFSIVPQPLRPISAASSLHLLPLLATSRQYLDHLSSQHVHHPLSHCSVSAPPATAFNFSTDALTIATLAT